MSAIIDVRDKIKELLLEKATDLGGLRPDDVFFVVTPEIYRAPSATIEFLMMSLDKNTTHHSILMLTFNLTVYVRDIDYKRKETELWELLLSIMIHYEKHPNLGDLGVVNTTVSNGIIGDVPGDSSSQSLYYFSFEINVNYGLMDTRVEGY